MVPIIEKQRRQLDIFKQRGRGRRRGAREAEGGVNEKSQVS